MPNLQNARKALRQNAKRAAKNKTVRDAFRKAVKEAVSAKTAEALRKAQQTLDKAAKAGVIKKNTAARRLSRLMKKVVVK